MFKFLIFVPTLLLTEGPGVLYGSIYEAGEVKSFYIVPRYLYNAKKTHKRKGVCVVLGYFAKKCSTVTYGKQKDIIILSHVRDVFNVEKIVYNKEDIDCSSNVTLVLYDFNLIVSSELLLYDCISSDSIYKDQLRLLTIFMTDVFKSVNQTNSSSEILFIGLNVARYIIRRMLRLIEKMLNLVQYSSTGMHIYNLLRSILWTINSYLINKQVSIKVGNYILSAVIDALFGLAIISWLVSEMPLKYFPVSILEETEVLVESLRNLLKWLMGVPAGLKLNYALNNFLGNFFLYHINLWWHFLVVTKPLLEFAFRLFLWCGCFGFTFQVSIVADFLALASFHMYCIYVYAARLYNLQLSGLIALWRLFLGRKYNPLRHRVDSCKYTTDQLFIGTLAFTILFFLFPTTVMYYVVFATLRLVAVGLGGLLIRLKILIQSLPLYTCYLWIFCPSVVTRSFQINLVKSKAIKCCLVLSALPVASSWWNTVQAGIPDSVETLPAVEWGKLLWNLLSGQLIYPM